MHHFKVMMKQSNRWSKVKKVKAKKGELEELEKFYQVRYRTYIYSPLPTDNFTDCSAANEGPL